MSKPADRAAEYQRLVVEQGHVTRSMQFSEWKPTEEEQQVIARRAARLIELAELLGYEEPERQVNESIAAWCRMNPLALSKRRVLRLIEEAGNVDGQVSIQIGDIGHKTKGGYFYQVLASDASLRNGVLHFTVPESVAEHFRQQGRREIQSEMRALLNAARA